MTKYEYYAGFLSQINMGLFTHYSDHTFAGFHALLCIKLKKNWIWGTGKIAQRMVLFYSDVCCTYCSSLAIYQTAYCSWAEFKENSVLSGVAEVEADKALSNKATKMLEMKAS